MTATIRTETYQEFRERIQAEAQAERDRRPKKLAQDLVAGDIFRSLTFQRTVKGIVKETPSTVIIELSDRRGRVSRRRMRKTTQVILERNES